MSNPTYIHKNHLKMSNKISNNSEVISRKVRKIESKDVILQYFPKNQRDGHILKLC